MKISIPAALAAAAMVAGLVACTGPSPSGSPAASAAASLGVPSTGPTATAVVASPASLTPSLAASAVPSATAAPTGAPTAAPSPSAAGVCAVKGQSGQLPSDRLIDVRVATVGGADVVTFVFGDPSIGNAGGTPTGTLATAEPPFSQAGSGEPIDLRGSSAIKVRFDHLSLQNDVGQPVFGGAPELRPDLPAITDVVNDDMSEGVTGWLVGYRGGGCVTLSTSGRNVTVAIAHPGR